MNRPSEPAELYTLLAELPAVVDRFIPPDEADAAWLAAAAAAFPPVAERAVDVGKTALSRAYSAPELPEGTRDLVTGVAKRMRDAAAVIEFTADSTPGLAPDALAPLHHAAARLDRILRMLDKEWPVLAKCSQEELDRMARNGELMDIDEACASIKGMTLEEWYAFVEKHRPKPAAATGDAA